jgi:hypothetical protein
MKKLVAASVAALFIAAPAPLAFAYDEVRYFGGPSVSLDDAIAIAQAYGLVYLKEVKLDDGEWEVEGCTADGGEIEVEIHAHTGQLLELEIERDDDC